MLMASNNPHHKIMLFCWILGVSDWSFLISIQDDHTVAHLKEWIVKKKPNAFATPISSISGRCVAFIYSRNLCSQRSIKVSISINQSVKNEVVKCKITDQ